MYVSKIENSVVTEYQVLSGTLLLNLLDFLC